MKRREEKKSVCVRERGMQNKKKTFILGQFYIYSELNVLDDFYLFLDVNLKNNLRVSVKKEKLTLNCGKLNLSTSKKKTF